MHQCTMYMPLLKRWSSMDTRLYYKWPHLYVVKHSVEVIRYSSRNLTRALSRDSSGICSRDLFREPFNKSTKNVSKNFSNDLSSYPSKDFYMYLRIWSGIHPVIYPDINLGILPDFFREFYVDFARIYIRISSRELHRNTWKHFFSNFTQELIYGFLHGFTRELLPLSPIPLKVSPYTNDTDVFFS